MSLLQLTLLFLQSALAQYKASGAAAELIAGIEASIAQLSKTIGTEISLGQLESLRVPVPDWPAAKV
jgi:hypothetical protein